jgi:hypothetical protein
VGRRCAFHQFGRNWYSDAKVDSFFIRVDGLCGSRKYLSLQFSICKQHQERTGIPGNSDEQEGIASKSRVTGCFQFLCSCGTIDSSDKPLRLPVFQILYEEAYCSAAALPKSSDDGTAPRCHRSYSNTAVRFTFRAHLFRPWAVTWGWRRSKPNPISLTMLVWSQRLDRYYSYQNTISVNPDDADRQYIARD